MILKQVSIVSVEPFSGPSLVPGTLIRPSLCVSLRSTPHPRTFVCLSPPVSTRSPPTSTHTRTACRLAPPRRPCTLARRTVGPFRSAQLPLIHQSLILLTPPLFHSIKGEKPFISTGLFPFV
uniref:Uncharacterized protein n=1 Tax=Caenorhabditis japonica TaxID=281687 RepID=A0A8R1ILB9_CAEJA